MSYRKQVIKSLSELIAKGDEADRCYACRALGAIGGSGAIPVLTERLRDEDIDVCIDAAEALGHLREPAAVSALLESLVKNPNGEVMIAAVEALGEIGGAETVAPLMEVAARRPNNIIAYGDESWDPWWDIQLQAVKALGRHRISEAVSILVGILNDEENQDIKSEILKALAEIGDGGEMKNKIEIKAGESSSMDFEFKSE